MKTFQTLVEAIDSAEKRLMHFNRFDRWNEIFFQAEPGAHLILAYWLQCRHGAIIPNKRSFDPIHIPNLLSYICLYEFEAELGDFVCRLSGENVNDGWGGAINGKTYREVVGDGSHPKALDRWLHIINDPRIQYGRISMSEKDDRLRAKRLIVPLADDEGKGKYIISLAYYPFTIVYKDQRPPIWDDVAFMNCADCSPSAPIGQIGLIA